MTGQTIILAGDSQPCEFCGAPVSWEPWQVRLDADLKLWPTCDGLGVVCSACDDKIIAIAIADEERYQRDLAEEEAEDDNE